MYHTQIMTKLPV